MKLQNSHFVDPIIGPLAEQEGGCHWVDQSVPTPAAPHLVGSTCMRRFQVRDNQTLLPGTSPAPATKLFDLSHQVHKQQRSQESPDIRQTKFTRGRGRAAQFSSNTLGSYNSRVTRTALRSTCDFTFGGRTREILCGLRTAKERRQSFQFVIRCSNGFVAAATACSHLGLGVGDQ